MRHYKRFSVLVSLAGILAIVLLGCPPREPQKPEITSFTINDGATETIQRLVTLHIESTGSPVDYMASELETFIGAEWLPYTGSPMFMLSEASGEKTIYLKLRNGAGESLPVFATILLLPSEVVSPWEDEGPVSGSIALPSSVDNVELLTLFGAVEVSETGDFALPQSYNGRYLGMVMDQDDDPVLLGWLDAVYGDDQLITPATTADVLLFYALGGYFLHYDYWADFRDVLAETTLSDNLASCIAACLEEDPKALVNGNPLIRAALEEAILDAVALAAKHPQHSKPDSQNTKAMLLHPISQGGIAVNNLGSEEVLNTVQISNDRRRITWVFFEHLRDHIKDDSGTWIDEKNVMIFDKKLESVTGLGGTISTFSDIVSGDLAYTPVTLDPFFIPNPTDPNIVKSEYRVVVVGPANLSIHQYESEITQEMYERWLLTSYEWLFRDLIFPFFATQLPGKNENLASIGGFGRLVESTIENLPNQIPDLLPLIHEGKYKESFMLVLNSIKNSSSLQEYIFNELILVFLGGDNVPAEAWARMNTAFVKIKNALSIADFLLGAYDLGSVLAALHNTEPALFFDIEVLPPTVTISPAIEIVPAAMSAMFTATVRDGNEPVTGNLRYIWQLIDGQDKGYLRKEDMSQGQQLMTTDNTIRFVAAIGIEEEEEVELKCTVSQYNNILSQWIVLGEDTCRITVIPNRGEAELFSLHDVWINDRGGTSFIYRVGVWFPKVPGATRYKVEGYNFYDERYYGDSITVYGAGSNWSTGVAIPERLQSQMSSDYEYVGLVGGSYSGSASGTPPDPNDRIQSALARFEGGLFYYYVVEADSEFLP